MSFSDFIDERMLISKNVLGTKEMKIKQNHLILKKLHRLEDKEAIIGKIH